jgi:hypothetical protein
MALPTSSSSFVLDDQRASKSTSQHVSTSQRDGINSDARPTEAKATSQHLEPADGGFAAWRLLCAAFVFEALLWGKLATAAAIQTALYSLHPRRHPI